MKPYKYKYGIFGPGQLLDKKKKEIPAGTEDAMDLEQALDLAEEALKFAGRKMMLLDEALGNNEAFALLAIKKWRRERNEK